MTNFSDMLSKAKAMQLKMKEAQDQIKKIESKLFGAFIPFVKNFYNVTKDLDKIQEFKKFIHLKYYRDWIYFALTSDTSIFYLEEGEDIESTDNMKIDPKSEVGKFLAPMCPKPVQNLVRFRRKIDPLTIGLATRIWTHKYGDISEQNLELGPEWKVEGDFQIIKFYNTSVGEIAQVICGLEIILKDGTVHQFGYTDSPNVEEFDLEERQILRLGICVSKETQLILAIQVNCSADNLHDMNMIQSRPLSYFFPRDQYDLPFERIGEEGLPRPSNGMFQFGHMDTQKLIKMNQSILVRDFILNGLKGITVMIDGKAIICEVQCKYLQAKEEFDQDGPTEFNFLINEMIEVMPDPDDDMDNMP